MAKDKNIFTDNFGNPVDDDQNSITAGDSGPVLMQDVHLVEKLAHFDRERIPERVVHAKGAGAYGYFEVAKDISKFTRAKFLSTVGKRTEVFVRRQASFLLRPGGSLIFRGFIDVRILRPLARLASWCPPCRRCHTTFDRAPAGCR